LASLNTWLMSTVYATKRSLLETFSSVWKYFKKYFSTFKFSKQITLLPFLKCLIHYGIVFVFVIHEMNCFILFFRNVRSSWFHYVSSEWQSHDDPRSYVTSWRRVTYDLRLQIIVVHCNKWQLNSEHYRTNSDLYLK
jgi:hypothetical protein